MNLILDGPEKEKPAKKKRVVVEKAEIDPPAPKAPLRQSNVYRTIAEWRDKFAQE